MGGGTKRGEKENEEPEFAIRPGYRPRRDEGAGLDGCGGESKHRFLQVVTFRCGVAAGCFAVSCGSRVFFAEAGPSSRVQSQYTHAAVPSKIFPRASSSSGPLAERSASSNSR